MEDIDIDVDFVDQESDTESDGSADEVVEEDARNTGAVDIGTLDIAGAVMALENIDVDDPPGRDGQLPARRRSRHRPSILGQKLDADWMLKYYLPAWKDVNTGGRCLMIYDSAAAHLTQPVKDAWAKTSTSLAVQSLVQGFAQLCH